MTVKCLGGYYDSTTDYIYQFLSNGTSSYLVYSDKDLINWKFVEGSNVSKATPFNVTDSAWFRKYGTNVIFTKNETQSGVNGIGGLLTISTTGSMVVYGNHNNPTGKVLEIHKERIWVGNISAMSGVAQNGPSWTVVSKFLPEKTDTMVSIVNSGIIFGSQTAKLIIPGHTYAVGDTVYVSGVVLSGVQDDFNSKFYTVTGLDGSGIVIDYNNTNAIAWASGGQSMLRGQTWGTALTIYEDASMGAGVFRCDDNVDDGIVQLKSSFGALAILRQKNPHIFTGSLESGSQSLSRPLNVAYGTVSPHTYLTAGGIWFISQYGVSKIEGTTIMTDKTQLDNIVDVSVIEPIKPTYDAITSKSTLLCHAMHRYLMIHDVVTNTTYTLDTLKSNWFRWYNRLVDRFLDVNEDVYSVYKHLVFKLRTDHQTFNMNTYAASNMNSSYFLPLMAQGAVTSTKVYNMFYALIQGASTSSATNPITINVYYNGSASPLLTFSWDVKTGSISTWNSFTTSGTLSWNTATTSGTKTWLSLLGQLISMFERKKYRLGAARELQIEIVHSDNSEVKISKLYLDSEILDIDTK